MYTYYGRVRMHGDAYQNVIVDDGIIVKQEIVGREGEWYGLDNFELIGKSKKALRGMGFKKIKAQKGFNNYTKRFECGLPIEENYRMEDLL